MEMVGTILFEPTVFATGIRLAICTIGKPARSISLSIVAPQRVQVPQVEVMMTASTPSALRCSTISRPMRAASA
jgi:hypothetical protein